MKLYLLMAALAASPAGASSDPHDVVCDGVGLARDGKPLFLTSVSTEMRSGMRTMRKEDWRRSGGAIRNGSGSAASRTRWRSFVAWD